MLKQRGLTGLAKNEFLIGNSEIIYKPSLKRRFAPFLGKFKKFIKLIFRYL